MTNEISPKFWPLTVNEIWSRTRGQLERDGLAHVVEIKEGATNYLLRQILYYANEVWREIGEGDTPEPEKYTSGRKAIDTKDRHMTDESRSVDKIIYQGRPNELSERARLLMKDPLQRCSVLPPYINFVSSAKMAEGRSMVEELAQMAYVMENSPDLLPSERKDIELIRASYSYYILALNFAYELAQAAEEIVERPCICAVYGFMFVVYMFDDETEPSTKNLEKAARVACEIRHDENGNLSEIVAMIPYYKSESITVGHDSLKTWLYMAISSWYHSEIDIY